MKVRMKVQMSGTRNGEEWPAKGEVAELPTAEAAHYVASGIAEEVTAPEAAPEQPETATAPAAEKRARSRKPRTTEE